MTQQWKKSSRSTGESNCLEWTARGVHVGIRDSKDPGPEVWVPAKTWTEFVTAVRSGRIAPERVS